MNQRIGNRLDLWVTDLPYYYYYYYQQALTRITLSSADRSHFSGAVSAYQIAFGLILLSLAVLGIRAALTPRWLGSHGSYQHI